MAKWTSAHGRPTVGHIAAKSETTLIIYLQKKTPCDNRPRYLNAVVVEVRKGRTFRGKVVPKRVTTRSHMV